jgi:ubiquinone/menaquinone biosynthesis C-methylase UbiE
MATTTASADTIVTLNAIKARQQTTWAAGVVAPLAGAASFGGRSPVARRGAAAIGVGAGVVTSARDGRRRAEAERLPMQFQEADAEALPFADSAFDAVLSSFGVMFAPNHTRAASEMLRVCRSRGRIGLANWTPRGFIGQLFKVVGQHVPPAPALTPPSRWGVEDYLEQLFGGLASDIHTTPRDFYFRYRSPQHWVDVFRRWYGPVLKAFEALAPDGQQHLEQDLLSLIQRFNRSGDATMVVPAEYLEVVIVRK